MLTDRQCAVILLREWLKGKTEPHHMEDHEITLYLDRTKPLSAERKKRILEEVDKIKNPFEEKVEHLYSAIKGWG